MNSSSGKTSFDNDNNVIFNLEANVPTILLVIRWIIVCAGLPLTLVAIFAVYSLVQKDHVTPVYIINLLMSDVLQLCCMAIFLTNKSKIAKLIYFFALIASIGSMVCVSLERYLAIAQPLWYRLRRNIKTSVLVCVMVWTIPFIYALSLYFKATLPVIVTICGIFLLLPLPLFIFFLVGTVKALSVARSIPAEEKRRIVAILVVLLFIYILLFLPAIIWFLTVKYINSQSFYNVAMTLLIFSPPSDLVMYILIRKSFLDRCLALVCSCTMSCTMSRHPQGSSMSNESMSASCNQVEEI